MKKDYYVKPTTTVVLVSPQRPMLTDSMNVFNDEGFNYGGGNIYEPQSRRKSLWDWDEEDEFDF